MSSRAPLDSFRSLTFYSDALTQSRRTPPIPQLKCIGKPCQLFQPDVVRCINEGGRGVDVDWKCEADLPDSLRFGRVEVSCEGWSGPGDPIVLKGSCALEYRLVRVPKALQNDDSYVPGTLRNFIDPDDPLRTIFLVLWSLFLLFISYQILKSCFTNSGRRTPSTTTGRPTPRPSGGGWFPGHNSDDTNPPPPPYSRHNKPSPGSTGSTGWTPGFWTGLGLGGLAASLWGRRRVPEPQFVPRRSMWDWERPTNWWGRFTQTQAFPATASDGYSRGTGMRTQTRSNDDRGEGSSNLGSMRRSTGFGGSSVR